MTLPLTAHLITNKSFVVKIGDFFVDNYLTINERVLGWQEVNKFHFFVRKSISESERRYKKNRWLFASHRIDVPVGYRELSGDSFDSHYLSVIDIINFGASDWFPAGSWNGDSVPYISLKYPALRVCVPDSEVETVELNKSPIPKPFKFLSEKKVRINSYPPRLREGYEILSDKEMADYTLAKGDYFIFKEKHNWEMINLWAGRKAAEFMHKKQFLVAVKREPKAKFPTDKPYPFGW